MRKRSKKNPNHYTGHRMGIGKHLNCLEAQSAPLTASSVCSAARQHDQATLLEDNTMWGRLTASIMGSLKCKGSSTSTTLKYPFSISGLSPHCWYGCPACVAWRSPPLSVAVVTIPTPPTAACPGGVGE